MKIINLIKKHIVISSVVLILLIWGGEHLWPLIEYKYLTPPSTTHVETIVLNLQPGKLRWQAIGTVKAAQDIIVASEVSGTVENIAVENGQVVKQGDILLNIRHQDILANLQRDQAILAQKELYHQRLQKLIKKNAISQEAVSQSLSDYQQAQATVKADQAQLDKYVIKAPFAGTIGIWQADIGQLVQPGDALVSLTALIPSYVDFMLPAKALDTVKVGDSIEFTTSSYPNRSWQGKIVALDPQLDNSTRSVKLRALMENADRKLVPRLYGQVTVVKSIAPQLSIPQEAVTYDPEGASVYILTKNTVNPRHIKLGEHQGENVIIESGLKPGDEIVTAGMMKLFPGMQVIVNKRMTQTHTTQQLS